MSTGTLSSKYQIVIPKEVREQLHLHGGQKFSFIVSKGVIHIVPIRPLKELAGFLKGIDTENIRDHEDRL